MVEESMLTGREENREDDGEGQEKDPPTIV